MTLSKITSDADWEGYYLDGKLIEESHNVRADKLITHLSKGFSRYEEYSIPESLMEELTCLPQSLDELTPLDGVTLDNCQVFL